VFSVVGFGHPSVSRALGRKEETSEAGAHCPARKHHCHARVAAGVRVALKAAGAQRRPPCRPLAPHAGASRSASLQTVLDWLAAPSFKARGAVILVVDIGAWYGVVDAWATLTICGVVRALGDRPSRDISL